MGAIRVDPIQTQVPREMLHERIWEFLASTPGGQELVNELERYAQSQNREETFNRLVDLYRGKPMEALVRAIMDPNEQAHPAERPDEEEIDEPLDLINRRPREWSANELVQFEYDIKTFRWQFTRWSVDLSHVPAPEEPEGPP